MSASHRIGLGLLLFLCLYTTGCTLHHSPPVVVPANPTSADLGIGIYPGAQQVGSISKAISGKTTILTGKFTTQASFQTVNAFYEKEAKKIGNYSATFTTEGPNTNAPTIGASEFNCSTDAGPVKVTIVMAHGAATEISINRSISN